MGSTFYFAAAPDSSEVADWLRVQPEASQEYSREDGILFHFPQLGALEPEGGSISDISQSPVVAVFAPQTRRRALWTIGEVHFLARGARQTLPGFDRLSRRFRAWIKQHPLIWDRSMSGPEGHGHYLEGGIRNVADRVYALPSALAAIESGQYFVAQTDVEGVLDKVCKTLRLRGVECD